MRSPRRILFHAMMIGIVLATPVVLVFGYFGARKLVYSYAYCGSYGRLDGKLGWTLAPNVSSCLSLENYLTGTIYFDSTIFTNELGFRDSGTRHRTLPGQVAAIGDSWTFGYGVDYEETYPHYLSEKISAPVSNMGVPAYSAAQTLLLLQRNVERLRPGIVVYFTLGLWTRSTCESVIRPDDLLAPCFWWDSANNRIELLQPAEGFVFAQAAKYVYPGGYLTAGYDKWQYFLFIKPLAILRKMAGWISNVVTGPSNVDAAQFNRQAMFNEILSGYARLMRAHGFAFLLVDPRGYYAPHVERIENEYGVRIAYLGPGEWEAEVETPARELPLDDVRVRGDGHFAAGKNRLIAAAIYRKLEAEEVLPRID